MTKRILTLLAVLLQVVCIGLHAAPAALTVTARTNGVLAAPANFWTANSNAIRAVVGSTGGGGGGGTNYLFDANVFSVSGTNVTLRSAIVLTNDLYVTNRAYNINLGPVNSVNVVATNTGITGIESVTVGGPVVTVLGTSELDLWTPAINGGTAVVGQYLRLVNASSGKAEWATASFLPLAGGTMSGAIAMGSQKVTGLGTPTASGDAATKGYVDTTAAAYLPLAGGTMTGQVNAGGYVLANIGTPTASTDAATKAYVDAAAPGLATTLRAWTQSAAYQLTAATYDSDNVLSSASVTWPDGSGGTFTRTSKNATFLTVDAFTVTHTSSGKTVTQSAVTRNANGSITVQPVLTVTP